MVAHALEVALEVLPLDDYRATAVIGVKTERISLEEVLIEEQDHMMLFVVDQTKWTHATWF